MARKPTYDDLIQRINALEASERIHRTILDNSPDLLYRTDLEGRIVYISPSVFKLSGYTAEEAIGMKMAEEVYLIPEERDTFLAKLQENGRIFNFEARLKRKDGSVWWASTNAHFFTNADGTVIGVEGVTRDISELKFAEAALKESEKKYRSLFETAMVGMYRTRIADGQFLAANQKLVRLMGYDSFERMAREYKTANHYTDPQRRRQLLDALETNGWVDGFEIEMRRTDGSTLQIAVSARAYPDRGYSEGVIVDITNLKQAEHALRESQEKLARLRKMESLGLLASGIAHDLNNILSGIVSYPELLLLDLPPGSKLRKPIETIQASGDRAAAVVQDLLTVARGIATTKEPLNLNDITGDYLGSPEYEKLKQYHPSVALETDLAEDLLNVDGSQVHLRKMLMNLVANAAEAIDGKGRITISTTNCYLDRPLRGYSDIGIGEYAVLSVADDGPGISSDDLDRIFEPFYTKKVMGRSGSGLGLAVVWNTVEDHKGHIDVRGGSNGTIMDLYFPITRAQIPRKTASIPLDTLLGNQETILVIDDVASQREISCRMLHKLGYQAVAVASGEQAVDYLKDTPVDLLLLDMVMDPGMNGRQTFERIIRIRPDQRAIIFSGLAETEEVRKTQRLGAGQYLKKPVALRDLGLAVITELARPPTHPSAMD
jgi:two-component system cell cycle sensor histidine kinase/response regulator CckA